MKVSLNWLSDYVDVSMPVAQLADLLTRIGAACDAIVETDADILLDLDVTSNRPDLLGHLGVAREIAAATGAAFTPPVIGELPTRGRARELTAVEVLDPALCPRYTARVLRNVTVGPSPRWLVERLAAVGLRGINNVVDVTNYVLFEYSQPLHSFDYNKLAEHRIVVRRAAAGEELVSIDQTRCRLEEFMLVIADAAKPVAIAGVMGGIDTEVTEDTTAVLIESAQFDPLTTRRTSRRLGLMSESNYRFERGVDPVGVDQASLRACKLILDLTGGELAEGVVDVWAAPYRAPSVTLRPRRTNALLGMDVPVERQVALLDRLGLSPRRRKGTIVCAIPPFRGDLSREVDLIEEVARLEGYDKVPVAPTVSHAVRPEGLPQRVRRKVVETLVGAGYDETVTFSFIDQAEAELFGWDRTVAVDPTVRKSTNVLRPTLLPSLLRACKTNQDAGTRDVSLFELAAVFPPSPQGGPGALPAEGVQLAAATTEEPRELRGALEALAERICPHVPLEARPGEFPGFADGAAAEVHLDGEAVGVIGRVSDRARDYYGLERAIAAATLAFDALVERAALTPQYQAMGRFPSVRRDLSLIVDEDVTWRRLLDAVQTVNQPMRVGIEYVTTFRGDPIPAGRKSVTVALEYRSPSETLRGEQVDEQIEQVLAALRRDVSADVRR